MNEEDIKTSLFERAIKRISAGWQAIVKRIDDENIT